MPFPPLRRCPVVSHQMGTYHPVPGLPPVERSPRIQTQIQLYCESFVSNVATPPLSPHSERRRCRLLHVGDRPGSGRQRRRQLWPWRCHGVWTSASGPDKQVCKRVCLDIHLGCLGCLGSARDLSRAPLLAIGTAVVSGDALRCEHTPTTTRFFDRRQN